MIVDSSRTCVYCEFCDTVLRGSAGDDGLKLCSHRIRRCNATQDQRPTSTGS